MMHPHTELRFINDTIGYGVVATKFIPKGTITWVFDKLDRVFSPKEVETLEPAYRDILDKYTFRDNKGHFVLCWDISKYVNHSFNSNCMSTAYDFEIAIRDIHPGEELTDDYGYLNLTEPFDCLPEAGTSRTRVMPDDLVHYHEEWDRKLSDAFTCLAGVEQPLKTLIAENRYKKAIGISRGTEKMDSILNCYYNDKQRSA